MKGIGEEPFQITLDKGAYGANRILTATMELEVISDPEPYTKEHKSKWKVINWYRKLVGTYWEHGYMYNVKIIEDEVKKESE